MPPWWRLAILLVCAGLSVGLLVQIGRLMHVFYGEPSKVTTQRAFRWIGAWQLWMALLIIALDPSWSAAMSASAPACMGVFFLIGPWIKRRVDTRLGHLPQPRSQQ